MKKLFLIVVAFIGFICISNSQNIAENAIGLRLGGGDSFGTEVTYQRLISENNRLEFDLGWRNGDDFDAIRFVGVYQWVWVLDGNFYWYTGLGAGIASFDIDLPGGGDRNSTGFLAAGNIGIEYDFDIPLLVSLDFRPELGFGNFNDDLDFDIALSFRYQF